jgi:hypothetical protein
MVNGVTGLDVGESFVFAWFFLIIDRI